MILSITILLIDFLMQENVWIIKLVSKKFINNIFKTITFSPWNQKKHFVIISVILEIILRANNLTQQTTIFHDNYPKERQEKYILKERIPQRNLRNDEIRFSTGGWRCVSCTTRSQLQLEPVIPLDKPSFLSRKLTTLLSGHAAGPFSFD